MSWQQCCHPLAVDEFRRRIARLEAVDQADVAADLLRLQRFGSTPARRGVQRAHSSNGSPRGKGRGRRRRRVDRPGGVFPGSALVVVDGGRQFYPPAAARLGIAIERLLLIHVDNRADHDSGLRSGPALSGRGGGDRLAGIAWGANSTRRTSAGCNWPPSGAEAWACSCGRRACGAPRPGPTSACWSSRGRGRRRRHRGDDFGWCCCAAGAVRKAAVWNWSSTMRRILCLWLPQGPPLPSGEGWGEGNPLEIPSFSSRSQYNFPSPPGTDRRLVASEGRGGPHSLAAWCRRFTPLLGVEEGDNPTSLFLDIGGTAHLRRRGGDGRANGP